MYVSKTVSGSAYTTLLLNQAGTIDLMDGLSLPSSLNEVQLTNGTSLSLTTDLAVSKLMSDGSGTVTLSDNSKLSISSFDDLNHGCQCNFDIKAGSTLQVNTDFDFTGNNPTLNLAGSLIANTFRIWDHGTVTVQNTGNLQVNSLTLHEYSTLDLKPGAIYSNAQSLTLGYNSTLVVYDDPLSLTLTLFHMKVKSTLDIRSATKTINLEATNVIIEDDAVLSVSGSGSLTGK